MTTKKQFTAEISLFSRIGHTPITKRDGAFCDKLATFSVLVSDGSEALKVATLMKDITPHAATAFYNVPDHPNQNTRNGWI